MFIADIKETGDNLFTDVNDNSDQLKPAINYCFSRIFTDSMTPAINLSPIKTTAEMINRETDL